MSKRRTAARRRTRLSIEPLEPRRLLDVAGVWQELGFRGASGGGMTYDGQGMSSADPEIGLNIFRNLSNYDMKNAVGQIEIPLYSISSDLWPMNLEGNKKYVKSFKLKLMPGIGHFVMLEDPEKFNKLLEEIIKEL